MTHPLEVLNSSFYTPDANNSVNVDRYATVGNPAETSF